MSPRVTVLMSVYNGLAYLREAIESVLNQTFVDFEFLIIDDASTDDSVDCIRSYKDDRIRLIRNERNVGQACSLNRGLGLSRGEYVARLDQDDVCLPLRLEKQVEFLDETHDVAIVCSWEHTIDSQGRRVRSWRRELANYGEYLGYLLIGKCPIWHPSVTFRRNVVLEVGGYDLSYGPSEDFELWSRLAQKRLSGAIVPEFLVLQRVHENRQSISRGRMQLENTRRAHDELVRAFGPCPEMDLVAQLLRMDDLFWTHCRSKEQLGKALIALNGLLRNARDIFRLTPEEFEGLSRVIFYRRLGPGVKIGEQLLFLPSIFFYPVLFSLSPLLIPKVKRCASVAYETFHELRYPWRLFQNGCLGRPSSPTD